MSKVEELREKLLHTIAGDLAMPSLIQMLDSLIAAAKEEERERIRKESEFVCGSKDGDHDVYYCPNEDTYMIPASVLSLAPKEKP